MAEQEQQLGKVNKSRLLWYALTALVFTTPTRLNNVLGTWYLVPFDAIFKSRLI